MKLSAQFSFTDVGVKHCRKFTGLGLREMGSNPFCITYLCDRETHHLTFWVWFLLHKMGTAPSTFWVDWEFGTKCPKGSPCLAHSKGLFSLLFCTGYLCLRAPQFSVWAGELKASFPQTILYPVSGCKELPREPLLKRLFSTRPWELGSVLSRGQRKWKSSSSGSLKGTFTFEKQLFYCFRYNKRSQRSDSQTVTLGAS